jgi:hypothetical protein
MHSLREVDIADSRVELQPLHDFEVHFVNHVPVRHGFLMSADTDEVGHAFQYDVGHLFRSEVGHHSEMKPATRRVATVGLD